ncbi:MAG TPA: cyclopropane-fatty-acyl-phospholipid synthase family protein, partial [Candidatus Binatus sp.]|nr:cyclopropane-fatty-acyl-phospholipid synthase family protein [Candidatus Binatus sp.]
MTHETIDHSTPTIGARSSSPTAPSTRGASPSFLDRIALQAMLAAAQRIRHGRLVVGLPDGETRAFGDATSGPSAELQVRDIGAARRILLGGELGAGEAYMDGLWSSPDLAALAKVASVNRDGLGLTRGWWRLPAKLAKTVSHRLRRNTIEGSRRNIAAHYDLGNDFYRLFLDETLTYSSAVFTGPDQPLAEAQRNKYRVIAERAGLTAGQHVLEIGTGWGGFALYAAGELGCRVTTITISKAQYELASERVREAGLDGLVTTLLRDYREIEGQFDAIVSIEMFEAVGAEYFTTFFAACDRALRPGGRLSMQTIAFPDVTYGPQVRGANWIQTYIFPGGLLPSLAAIEHALHGTRFLVRSVQDISSSYVRTLSTWRSNFMGRLDEVRAMG